MGSFVPLKASIYGILNFVGKGKCKTLTMGLALRSAGGISAFGTSELHEVGHESNGEFFEG